MPSFTVRASVVDITSDAPRGGDKFWLDTNVLYWQTYSRASMRTNPPKAYQTRTYPGYLNRAIRSGASLHWFALSFAELAHQIESAEREIAENTGLIPYGTKPKEFRHDHAAMRAGVVSEITNCWQDVESLATELPCSVAADAALVRNSLPHLNTCAVDGYDLFTLEALKLAGVMQVISDDGDFCSVAGITLFTANRAVLTAASQQGKLIHR